MKLYATVDDLLRDKDVTLEEEKKLGRLIEAARRRKEILDRDRALGQEAAQDLSASLLVLGEALERLAASLEESAGKLAGWAGAPSVPGGQEGIHRICSNN